MYEERFTAEFLTEFNELKEFFRSMVVVSGVLDFLRRRSGLEGFETGSIVYNCSGRMLRDSVAGNIGSVTTTTELKSPGKKKDDLCGGFW